MRDNEDTAEGRRFLFPKQTDWSRINFTFLVFVLGIKTVFCILLFIYNHVLLFFIFFMSTVISLYALVVNTFKALTLYIVILTSILTSIFLSLFNIIHVEYIASVFKEVFLSSVLYSVLPLFILELFVAIIYTCLKRRRRGYIEKRLRELKIIIDGGRNREKGEKLLSLQIDLEKNELNTYDKTYKYYLTNYKNKKYICIEKKTDYSSEEEGEEDRSAHHIGNDYIDYNAISSNCSTLKNQQRGSGRKIFQEEKNAYKKGPPKSDSLSYYHVSEDLSFIHSGIKKYAKRSEKSSAKRKKSGRNDQAEGDTHNAGSFAHSYGSQRHIASPLTKGRKRQWSNDKHSVTDEGCTNLVNNDKEDDAEGTATFSHQSPSQTQLLTQQVERRSSKTKPDSWTETLPNGTPDQGENSKKGSAEFIQNSFSLENYEEVNYIIENFIEKNKEEAPPSGDLALGEVERVEQQNGADETAQEMDELDVESKGMQMDGSPQDGSPQDETPLGAFDPTPLPNVENHAEEANVQSDEEKGDHLFSHMTSQVEEELIKIMASQSSDHEGETYAKCTAEEKDSGECADIEEHHDDILAKLEEQQNNQGDELHSTASEMEANQKSQSGAGEVEPNDMPNSVGNPLICVYPNMEEETKQVGGTNQQELLMGEQYDNFKSAEVGAGENSPSEETPVSSPTNKTGEHTGKVTATHDGEACLEEQLQLEGEMKEQRGEQSGKLNQSEQSNQPQEKWDELPIELPSDLPVEPPSGEPSQLHIEQRAALPSPPASSVPHGEEEKHDGDGGNEDSHSENTSEWKKTHEGETQVRNFPCTNFEQTNLLRSANYEVGTKEWIKLEKKDIELLKQSVNIDSIEHIPIDDFYTKNMKERGANLFSYSIHSSNVSEFLKIGVDQKPCASWGAQQEESLTSSEDICKKVNFEKLEINKNGYVTLFEDAVIPLGGLNDEEKATEWMNRQPVGAFHLDSNIMGLPHESSHVEGANQPEEDSHQKCSEQEGLDNGKEKESNEKNPHPLAQLHISNAFSSNFYTTDHGQYSNYEEVIKDNSNIAEAFLNSGMHGEKSEMGRSNISDELPPSSFHNERDNLILNYSSCNDDTQSVPNSSLILVKGEHSTKELESSTNIFHRGIHSNSGNANEPPNCVDDKDTNEKQNDTHNSGSNDLCETTSIFKQRKSFFENLKKDKSLSSYPAKMPLSNERNALRRRSGRSEGEAIRMVSGRSEGEVSRMVSGRSEGEASRMVSGRSEGEILNSNSSINQHKKGNPPVEESNVSSSTPDGEDYQENAEPPVEKFAKLKKAKNIKDNFYIINDKLKSSGKEKKDTSVMGMSPDGQLTPSNNLAGRSTFDRPKQIEENEMEDAKMIDQMEGEKIIDQMEDAKMIDQMANPESKQKITQHFVIYDQSDLATPRTKLDEGAPTMGETQNLEKKKKFEGTPPNTVITLNNCSINSTAGVPIKDGQKNIFTSATQLSKDTFIKLGNAETVIQGEKTEGSYHKGSLLGQVKEVPTFGSSEEPCFQHRKKKYTELKKKTTPMGSNPLSDAALGEDTNSKLSAFADMSSDDTKEVLPSERMQSEHLSIEAMNSGAIPHSGGLLPPADKSLLIGSTQMEKLKDDFLNMNSCDSSAMYRDFMDAMNLEGRVEEVVVKEVEVKEEEMEEEEVKEEEVKDAEVEEVIVEEAEEAEADEVPELVEIISEQMEATSKSGEAPPEQAGNNPPHGTSHSAEEEADAETEEGSKPSGPNGAALESEDIHVPDDLSTQKAHLEMEKTNAMENNNPTCDVSSEVHADKHEADKANTPSDHLEEDQSPDTATDVKEIYTNGMLTENGADEQPFSDDKGEGEEKPNEELTAKATLQEELTTKENFEGGETEPSYPHEEDTPLGDEAIYEGNEIPPLEKKKEDTTSSPTEQALDNLENVIDPPIVEVSIGDDEPKEELPPDEENSGDETVDHNNHMDASEKAKEGPGEGQTASKLNQEKAKNYRNKKNNKRRNKRR
ncbi:unnamed protein product [Plasmodium vivax]|uniref:(malaria parasite P. vivax) hypothetical protein n=1 Tax=Plasmodium vivax TaxID=5855 RepID=A0A8S4HH12_PLAVI|nr:unnamed protein product [Plasmodium vivax]